MKVRTVLLSLLASAGLWEAVAREGAHQEFVKHAVVIVNNRLGRNPKDEKALHLLRICEVLEPGRAEYAELHAAFDEGKRPQSQTMEVTDDQVFRALAKRGVNYADTACRENGSYGDWARFCLLVLEEFEPKNVEALAALRKLQLYGYHRPLGELLSMTFDLKAMAEGLVPPSTPIARVLDPQDQELGLAATVLGTALLAEKGDDPRGVALVRLGAGITPLDEANIRAMANLDAGVPFPKVSGKASEKNWLERLVPRVEELRQRLQNKQGDPAKLLYLYLRVGLLLQPDNAALATVRGELEKTGLSGDLQDLLAHPVDLNGSFDPSDWSRLIQIAEGPFRRRESKSIDDIVQNFHVSARGHQAVRKTMDWLVTVQGSNGSWGSRPAHTALALLVFLGHGELPGSKQYGPAVSRALHSLVGHVQEEWMPKLPELKPAETYEISLVTMALAEAYGMTHLPELREPLIYLVRVILQGQQEGGSFDYGFKKNERWDLSLTAWQLQALQSVRQAGVASPLLQAALEKAERFCTEIAFSDVKGVFSYAQGDDKRYPNAISFGTAALFLLPEKSTRTRTIQRRMVKILYRDRLASLKEADVRSKWDAGAKQNLYGWYFDALAMFHVSPSARREWLNWVEASETTLVGSQSPEGFWEAPPPIGGKEVEGRILTSSFCALILEAPYRCIPR